MSGKTLSINDDHQEFSSSYSVNESLSQLTDLSVQHDEKCSKMDVKSELSCDMLTIETHEDLVADGDHRGDFSKVFVCSELISV